MDTNPVYAVSTAGTVKMDDNPAYHTMTTNSRSGFGVYYYENIINDWNVKSCICCGLTLCKFNLCDKLHKINKDTFKVLL